MTLSTVPVVITMSKNDPRENVPSALVSIAKWFARLRYRNRRQRHAVGSAGAVVFVNAQSGRAPSVKAAPVVGECGEFSVNKSDASNSEMPHSTNLQCIRHLTTSASGRGHRKKQTQP